MMWGTHAVVNTMNTALVSVSRVNYSTVFMALIKCGGKGMSDHELRLSLVRFKLFIQINCEGGVGWGGAMQ